MPLHIQSKIVKYWFDVHEDYLSKKSWFGYYLRFPSFFSGIETSGLHFCFIIRKCKDVVSSGFFINLEEWNIDAFKQIYFHMIS